MPMSSPISGGVLQGKKSCNERKNRHTKTHQVEVAVSTASEDDAIRYKFESEIIHLRIAWLRSSEL